MDSITEFFTNGIINLMDAAEKYLENPQDMAGLESTLHQTVDQFACSFLSELLTRCNDEIKKKGVRKNHYDVVRTDERQLLCSFGIIRFQSTLYKDRKTGEYKYLMNQLLGIQPHEKVTTFAEAQVLEEAAGSSYAKGGRAASPTAGISKTAVKDKIHRLQFPADPLPEGGKKKVVDYLYIDADEDHVALQFHDHKGDVQRGENGYKDNCQMVKVIYVYEGKTKEGKSGKRKVLSFPYYMSGVYSGNGNEELWNRMYAYLDAHYDLSQVKKIYLNGDGAAWIKAGTRYISGLVYVLDEFHLQKYLVKMTSHMKDSQCDAKAELRAAIRNGDKKKFKELTKTLSEYETADSGRERVLKAGEYILDNWKAAGIRLTYGKTLEGCSAEGHVSYLLSDRLSSRPMGWSRTGADKMARLRAYIRNGGDVLELVRYQRAQEELPYAVGAEDEKILSCHEVLASERERLKNGKYYECLNHSVEQGVIKRLSIAINRSLYSL